MNNCKVSRDKKYEEAKSTWVISRNFFSVYFFLAANILYINKHTFGDGISRACNNGILNEVNAPHKICFLFVHLLFMLLRYDAICASLINGKECEVKGVCVIQSLSLDCVVHRTAQHNVQTQGTKRRKYITNRDNRIIQNQWSK